MFTRLIVGVPLLLGLTGLAGCAGGVPGDGGAAPGAIAFAESAAPFASVDPLEGALIRDPANSYDLEIPLQPDLGPRPEASNAGQEAIEVEATFSADPFAEEPPPAPEDLPPGAVTSWFDLDGGMEDVPLSE